MSNKGSKAKQKYVNAGDPEVKCTLQVHLLDAFLQTVTEEENSKLMGALGVSRGEGGWCPFYHTGNDTCQDYRIMTTHFQKEDQNVKTGPQFGPSPKGAIPGSAINTLESTFTSSISGFKEDF